MGFQQLPKVAFPGVWRGIVYSQLSYAGVFSISYRRF